ncbi:MAG: hypothetical protein JHC88_04075 [Niveispirillum sp.]|nr:hypothetical protein [Niveispirillum sp.]
MPDKLPLSVFIIALNEADRIGPVIQTVSGCAVEVLGVGSGSNNGTQDRALAHHIRYPQGLISGTPVAVKSATFRVTTDMP